MSSSDEKELRALQARAYGPNADPLLDGATWDRLQSLEREAVPDLPPTSAPMEEEEKSTSSPRTDDAAHFPQPATREPPWRRVPIRTVLWGATVLAVIVTCVTAIILTQRARLAPFTPQAELIAELAPTTGVALPGYFEDDPASPPTTFDTFAGIGAVVTPAATSSDGGYCLYILDADTLAAASNASLDGPLRFGCSAAAFPAVVQFTVAASDPEELQAAVPTGEAVQFVYDAAVTQVVVFRLAG